VKTQTWRVYNSHLAHGKRIQRSALNGQTNFPQSKVTEREVRKIIKNNGIDWKSLSLGEGIAAYIKLMEQRPAPTPEGPARRLTDEQEAMACREMKIFTRCSRTCTEEEKFGGCKGRKFFKSCGR